MATKVTSGLFAQHNLQFRNKLINGSFAVWQRGTSQTTSGYGSDDRWDNPNNGSTKTHSREAFALGQTDVPGEPKYYSRTVVTSAAAAGNYVIKGQRIESVRTFAGRKVTLSFHAKADAAKNVAVEFVQDFGFNGSPSPQVLGIGAQLVALTTVWKKYKVTVDIPSIAGKTIGTTNTDFLGLFFWFDAGSNYATRSASLGQQSGTFDIALVQVEEGDVATEFEYTPYDIELLRCQRYYVNYFAAGTPLMYCPQLADSVGWRRKFLTWPVEMRGTPTVTMTATTNGALASNSPSAEKVDRFCVDIFADVTSATAFARLTSLTASAEL